ncbi:MAG: restriction endonuclease [Deltaproteobacteria bacterium]|jgi:site-specific DNA-methyltransferase (adenine-specific)|nr:restriction endonuclease [Deltaproteobacteria bacterium]
MSDFKRLLCYGDNLQVLRDHVRDESVDLIYLDPPFNSKRLFNVFLDAEAQATAFDDTWTWNDETERDLALIVGKGQTALYELLAAFKSVEGERGMAPYCVMMAARILELRRVLKPTGSVYLHCDPTASHYLKTVMDVVFRRDNFRNEVIWKRTFAHGRAKRWGPVHDCILYYSKSVDCVWNRTVEAYGKSYLDRFYNKHDDKGTYRVVTLDGPGRRGGSSGALWRGVDPSVSGRHWEVPPDRSLPPWFEHPPGYSLMNVQDRLDVLDEAGLIYWPPKGTKPHYKKYLLDGAGNPLQDIISDIPPLSKKDKERLEYPTQKPSRLLERIISASSNPGDLVLDPFCGCGTAIEAAENLGRRWIGIDITHIAVGLVEKRLEDGFPGLKWETLGIPKDLAVARDLAERDKYQFQYWACSLVRAHPVDAEHTKGADRGIDGVRLFNDENPKAKLKKIIVAVKGGANVNPSMVRDLRGTVERDKAAMGLFVTLTPPTKAMAAEAAGAGHYVPPEASRSTDPIPRIQILTVEDLLKGIRPNLPPDFTQGGGTFKKNRTVTESPKPTGLL